jgi:hypothetical protein
MLTLGKQLQDPTADRIAEDVEGVHARIVEVLAYISQE